MTHARIRSASEKDIDTLVVMSARFLELTPYGQLFPAIPGHLEMLARLTLEHGTALLAELHPPGCPGFEPEVCECPEGLKCRLCLQPPSAHKVVGMLALVIVPHPLTGASYCEEVVWWVEPEHRGGIVGPKLLEAAETWVSTKSVTMVKMVAPAGSPVGAFLERRGYAQVETAFIKLLSAPTRTAPLAIGELPPELLERIKNQGPGPLME